MKLSKSEAGHLGGLAQIKKNGNPGTTAGRKLGGLRSQNTHKKLQTNFIQRKEIFKPKYSEQLAEFTGIMLGDGHIGKYQASITTHSGTDFGHATFVSEMASELFFIKAPMRKRKSSNAVEIVLSSYDLCRYLENFCFKAGNKVQNQVPVPSWIKRNKSYIQACLRGLFDTDGCIFLDKHQIKGILYQHMGLAFTNYNKNILTFFKEELESLGFHPTQTTEHQVFLRRKKEIDSYFTLVGSSNEKHIKKYGIFVKQIGRVA